MSLTKGQKIFIVITAALWLLVFMLGCATHCRIDQRVPEGETFESAKQLTKEQCK